MGLKKQIVQEINTCIANNGVDGVEVPLWECPCRDCTRMEWECLRDLGDKVGPLGQFRAETWPELWGQI